MSTKRKIYFRADAGPEIGYGHYIRSLALADILKQDFDCTMFTQTPTDYQLREAKEVCPIVSLPNDDSKFEKFLDYLHGDEIVVLDNYFFTTDYQRAIKAKGCKLVCIDDMHDKHYVADVVINQGMGYSRHDFSVESYTILCMGLEYSLLRKHFLKITEYKSIKRTRGSVVVAFGGSDPSNLTERYVTYLFEKSGITHIDAIIGDAYNGRLLDSPIVQYHKNLNADQVRNLFLCSEYAVLPSSTMMLEALACGVKIIGGYYVANQKHDYENFLSNHYIYGVGDWLSCNTQDKFRALIVNDDLFKLLQFPHIDFSSIPGRLIRLFQNIEIRNKRLLILGGGQMQVPVIQCANELGAHTIVSDMDPHAPGLLIAKERLLISTMDLEKIGEYCQYHPIDGILTTSDAPVNVVATIGKKFNLPAMSVETARLCTNKYLQRECFRRNGIKTPQYMVVTNGEIDVKSKSLSFPLIVKPIDSSASRGVKKVESIDELMDAIHFASNQSRSHTVIVEEFIEGIEFSVESFSQKGETRIIAITQKQTIGEEYGCFVEDTHIEPAMISEDIRHLIEAEVLAAIKALGADNCPNHTEVKINDKGAFIIESACRLGGDYITSDLVPLSTGVNMLENLIRVSIGEPVDLDIKYQKCSAVQFLNTTNYERCTEFINKNHPAIKRFERMPYSNKQISSSLDRLGYIILQTETLTAMKQILKLIK